jgi:hypothetical protein
MTADHGTATRYRKYACRCDDCRGAQAAAIARARRQDPEYAKRQAQATNALIRAKTRLAALHPDDLLRLYNEERESVGLAPVNDVPRGRRPKP